MTWLRMAPEPPPASHTCLPPMRPAPRPAGSLSTSPRPNDRINEAAGDDGYLWMCDDCLAVWIIRKLAFFDYRTWNQVNPIRARYYRRRYLQEIQ